MRRGRGRRGDRAGAADGQLPRRFATGSATSRRGTSAWPAAARSTSWSSPVPWRRSRRPGAGSSADGSRSSLLPADAPPPELGEHRPGRGGEPRADAPGRRGRHACTAASGPRLPTRALVAAATDAPPPRDVPTVEVDGRQLFIEAFPVRPRLVIVGADGDRPSARRDRRDLGLRAVVIDGRPAFAAPRASRTSNGSSTTGPRGRRRDRTRPERRGRHPLARSQVRRAGHRRRRPARRALRRRDRLAQDAGRSARAARGGRARGGAVASVHGPIGLDLGGRAPAETALAIMAEVVATGMAVRRLGTPSPPRVSDWARPLDRPRDRPLDLPRVRPLILAAGSASRLAAAGRWPRWQARAARPGTSPPFWLAGGDRRRARRSGSGRPRRGCGSAKSQA